MRLRRVKRPIYVACEGKSETGYIRWLNRLADAHGVPVALTAHDMKGGAPTEIANKAKRFLRGSIGGPKTYRGKYLILDRDPSVNSRQVLDRAMQMAEKHSFGIVWQHICHEGFLLKHFARTERLGPSTAGDCNRALLNVWPDYRKGLDATAYEQQLSDEHLSRARGNLPELDAFLNDIGWN